MKKVYLLMVMLIAVGAVGAGCGGDDDKGDKNGAPPATQTGGGDTTPEAGAPTLTEERIRAIIEIVNEDPAQLCDPQNATAELLDQLGGKQACLEQAAQEETGKPYEITDISIEDPNTTATATIEDEEGVDKVTFVVEGNQIKISAIE